MTSKPRVPNEKHKAIRDNPEQSRDFIKKAREVEASDKDASEADALIGALAKKPHKPHKP